ncbi:MAG: hypothetical protein AAB214_01615 [Fibrobacterota bacterium]
MLEKLPIPTDSLYKFAALTGLVLFVLPFVLIIQINRSTNDTVIKTVLAVDSLSRQPGVTPHDSARIVAMNRVREVAVSDRTFASYFGGAVAGVGGFTDVLWIWTVEIQNSAPFRSHGNIGREAQTDRA